MKRGTFVVVESDADSAVLRDVSDGQVHTLSSNPGVERREVLEAALAPDPPLEVTWSVEAVDDRRTVPVEAVDERPDERAYEAAPPGAGELVELDDAGDTVHVLTVPVDETADAVADVAADEATLTRAVRLGSDRVEVRGADGVLTVRY